MEIMEANTSGLGGGPGRSYEEPAYGGLGEPLREWFIPGPRYSMLRSSLLVVLKAICTYHRD